MLKIRDSYFIVLVTLLIACDNPFVITPGSARNNIVTGIYLTDAASNIYGIWGNPNQPIRSKSPKKSNDEEEESPSPTSFGTRPIYPNPFVSSANFTFTLPEASKVSIWIETAYWPGEDALLPFRNVSVRPFIKEILMENQRLSAGDHVTTLSFRTKCFGGKYDHGFYRVFLQAGDFLSYQDFYAYGPKQYVPKGLENGLIGDCLDLSQFD